MLRAFFERRCGTLGLYLRMSYPRLVSLVFFLLAPIGLACSKSTPREVGTENEELVTAQVDALQPVVERALGWMSTVPTSELRFDAMIMLSQIQQRYDLPEVRAEVARAQPISDRDDDHPHRVLWVPELEVSAEVTAGWALPSDPQKRAKPNSVLSEAMHCGRNGFRAETVAHVCGVFRDDGGYYSTHALWALTHARALGCLDLQATAACVLSMQTELLAAQPKVLAPKCTLDTDIYAERLLTLVLSGYVGSETDAYAHQLLAQQAADGSFAKQCDGDPIYYGYHTTGVALWALSEWQATRKGDRSAGLH